MMKKTTSGKIALLKQLAIVPVIAVAVALFGQKVVAENNDSVEPTPNVNLINKTSMRLIAPVSEMKVIPPATHDAPPSVLKEYAAQLHKHKLLPLPEINPAMFVNNAVLGLPKPERLQLQDLYDKMSKEQRQHEIIQFGPLLLPAHAMPPRPKEFASLTKDGNYRLWVDGKQISRFELAKHKSSEFAYYTFGGLKMLPDYEKYKADAKLMTPAYFEKDRKLTEAGHYQIPMVNVITKKTSTNAVQQSILDEKNAVIAQSNDQVKEQIDTVKLKVVFNGKPVPFAKNDAPQNVLDQFTAILTKYRRPSKTGEVHFSARILPSDKQKLERLYAQMSNAQQKDQWFEFRQPFPIPTKSRPTEKQLVTWQDAIKYGVWIDDERVKNADLAKYKLADFDYVSYWRLMPLAVKNDKFHYQIELMTPAFYEKFHQSRSIKDWNMFFRTQKPV